MSPPQLKILAEAQGHVADGQQTLRCRTQTPVFLALPAWPCIIQEEKGLGSASGDSAGGKTLPGYCVDLVGGRTVVIGRFWCSPELPVMLPLLLHRGFNQCEETRSRAIPAAPALPGHRICFLGLQGAP